jgi:hypothetical protein
MSLSTIYAHQGGWDEILLVAGPIAVIVLLLRMAERRATRQRAAAEAHLLQTEQDPEPEQLGPEQPGPDQSAP